MNERENDITRAQIEAEIEQRFRDIQAGRKLPKCPACGVIYVGGKGSEQWLEPKVNLCRMYYNYINLFAGDVVTRDEQGSLLCRRCSPDMPGEDYDRENRRER